MKVVRLLGILLFCLLIPLSLIGIWGLNVCFYDRDKFVSIPYKECLPIPDNYETILIASVSAIFTLPLAIVKTIFMLPVILCNECSKRASEYEKLKEVKK
jgi:hypothetical protein